MSYTNPTLREHIKQRIMNGDKGGRPNQWSARKAQLLAHEYEKAGGGYIGSKSPAQKSLSKWTAEKWRTKSGKPSLLTGERYLPERAIKALSPKQYMETTLAKQRGVKQYVAQPRSIAKITARYRIPP